VASVGGTTFGSYFMPSEDAVSVPMETFATFVLGTTDFLSVDAANP
jgi:hypothetical protein